VELHENWLEAIRYLILSICEHKKQMREARRGRPVPDLAEPHEPQEGSAPAAAFGYH
jgi:hypothetical protein